MKATGVAERNPTAVLLLGIDIEWPLSHTFPVTHSKHDFSPRNEYFLACFFAVVVGLLRLGTHSRPGAGLLFLGVLILAIAIGVYYQFGRTRERQREGAEGVPPRGRLLTMAIIWYLLALALSGAFVRGPLQRFGSGGSADLGLLSWGMGLLGVGVAGFALWRIIRIIRINKEKIT